MDHQPLVWRIKHERTKVEKRNRMGTTPPDEEVLAEAKSIIAGTSARIYNPETVQEAIKLVEESDDLETLNSEETNLDNQVNQYVEKLQFMVDSQAQGWKPNEDKYNKFVKLSDDLREAYKLRYHARPTPLKAEMGGKITTRKPTPDEQTKIKDIPNLIDQFRRLADEATSPAQPPPWGGSGIRVKKLRKHKSRKHKSRKHKSRKHKSRKYKSRK